MTKAQAVIAAVLVTLSVSLGFRQINPFTALSATQNLSVKADSVVPKPEWVALYDSLDLKNQGLSEKAFFYAWYGFQKMKSTNQVLAIADFSQSSRNKRLYVIDLLKKKMLLNTYVAHGRNSGQEFAERFSNDNSSFQSSLGFYKTLGTYQGKHGLSLRLEGLEKGINDRALQRAIVMHGADYVSEAFIKNTGRLGRSLGCPAVSIADSRKLISLMCNGAGLFIFSKDQRYEKASSMLAGLSFDHEAKLAAAPQASGEPLLYTSGK
ncbi:murein L,D-transpeptidase catalytic domain family protein [Dyadobacter sandarakinus]|uniref:Murein L,D-transpeptidase catalytic domain family protein n=1 Tax=Dyadobacter sandarakinus TaxID=2747268 RepID=A0ABX7I883_9BACT|nr:murein L,D-transpeptidase catalytic domain family protein [Dyadobacter sandarakinus]QRR02085.1 murein L,D-transpeptidase catalytic domain family protein [Dyadobacter sandarakinus]